ncbi:MAG: acyl-CoA dehydrogenase family protein [Gammaproteobacteria bacterium]
MDLSFPKEYDGYREEVRQFLAGHWPPRGDAAKLPRKQQMTHFLSAAIERGYLARNVPRRYGGSEQPEDAVQATIIREEFTRAGAPRSALGNYMIMIPALLQFGTEWQREKFIRNAIIGVDTWCQGFSEPGAGSDLASLRTRAELVGDEWVITGQKIWTTYAHISDYIFMLVRTDPAAPKHQGISYLLVNMKQPGIEVRPLKQLSGDAEFNEVFFTEARAPKDWMVGEPGQGWAVKSATLKAERTGSGGEPSMAMFDRVLKLARKATRNGAPAMRDPEVRQWLANLEAMAVAHLYSGHRLLARDAKGADPGPWAYMNKLYSTDFFAQEAMRIARELIGDDGLLLPRPRGIDWPKYNDREIGDERWVSTMFTTLSYLIAGGTSNIQRNIIAERGYGLPRDKDSGAGK